MCACATLEEWGTSAVSRISAEGPATEAWSQEAPKAIENGGKKPITEFS